MKINLTPVGTGNAWEIDLDHGTGLEYQDSDYLSSNRYRGPSETYSVEFDGVVRTVRDFRNHIRSLKKTAEVRHDEMLRLAAENDQLREEHAQEIALAKDTIEGLRHQRFVAQESLKQKTEDTHRLQVRNRDLETRLLEAHEEGKLLKTALEDSRNHGRYVLTNDPQPLQDPTAKMTVFGVAYEEAYKRVRDYDQVAIDKEAAIEELNSERRRNAELKSQLEYEVGRTGERVREVTGLQEALRQKNEIIKDIREKVAEARIYE